MSKHNTTVRDLVKSGALKKFQEIPTSRDPRAPHADITNAPELFGDPFDDDDDDEMGDADYGDVEDFMDDEIGDADYGDVADRMAGDPDMVALYNAMSGDPSKRKRVRRIVGGAALGGTATLIAARALKARRARKRVAGALKRGRFRNTIRNARMIRNSAGVISPNSMTPFFNLKGAKVNSAPLTADESFVTEMLKYMLDYQNAFTPFYEETIPGGFAVITWTVTATGPATRRYFAPLILRFGTNALNASPGTIVEIGFSLETVAGPLAPAIPFVFTISQGFDITFIFFPWQLVANKPLPVLGQYGNGDSIVITMVGLSSASAVNLIVPGSQHPWITAMRNALVKSRK
jgi:hypothetical protein